MLGRRVPRRAFVVALVALLVVSVVPARGQGVAAAWSDGAGDAYRGSGLVASSPPVPVSDPDADIIGTTVEVLDENTYRVSIAVKGAITFARSYLAGGELTAEGVAAVVGKATTGRATSGCQLFHRFPLRERAEASLFCVDGTSWRSSGSFVEVHSNVITATFSRRQPPVPGRTTLGPMFSYTCATTSGRGCGSGDVLDRSDTDQSIVLF